MSERMSKSHGDDVPAWAGIKYLRSVNALPKEKRAAVYELVKALRDATERALALLEEQNDAAALHPESPE